MCRLFRRLCHDFLVLYVNLLQVSAEVYRIVINIAIHHLVKPAALGFKHPAKYTSDEFAFLGIHHF